MPQRARPPNGTAPLCIAVTGDPGCGKTTLLRRVAAELQEELTVAGLYTEELRRGGARVGFRFVDIATGRRELLAHVDREQGPRVGKYRVCTEGVDDFAVPVLETAALEAGLVVIDEVGPMELTCRALKAANPTAIQYVTIVSHHQYNEYFKPRLWQRNWSDVQTEFPSIGYIRIADQNGATGTGLKGTADSDFSWLQTHADPNLNWVYDRIVAGKPDVSDAGMVCWLIGINGSDEKVS